MEPVISEIQRLADELRTANAHLQAGTRLLLSKIAAHYGDEVAAEPIIQKGIEDLLVKGTAAYKHPCWARLGGAQPARTVLCFRGEHGEDASEFQTRHPTLSFSTKEIATEYAQTPNMQHDTAISPRVFSCEVQFLNPWIPYDDPYSSAVMPMSKFRELMQESDYRALVRSADVLGWLSSREDDFSDFVAEHGYRYSEMDAGEWASLLDRIGVEAVDELNIDAFHIVDQDIFIQTLKQHGHDGVIIGTSGDFEGDFEYRPFYRHQVKVNDVEYLAPEPLQVRVVRGVQCVEHITQPAVASITFTNSRDVARHYAENPNVQTLTRNYEHSPALVYADVTIRQPIVNTTSDPMIELSRLREVIGDDGLYKKLLHDVAYWVCNTNAWEEHAGKWQHMLGTEQLGDTALFDKMLEQHLDILSEPLSVQLYLLLDRPDFIDIVKRNGFDGAVYRGSGVSMDAVEYRVFSAEQIKNVQAHPLRMAPSQTMRI